MAGSRRRLSAIVFADIAGYTELSHRDEDAAVRLADVFQSLCRHEAEGHSGRVVKFIGDGALAVFDSAEAAVRCSLSVRDRFRAAAMEVAPAAELRLGVHLGEVVESDDGDVYGDGVNTASRIEGRAPAGRVAVSRTVFQQLRQRQGYRLSPHGTHTLKGVPEPVEIFLVEWEEAASAGLASELEPPRHLGPYELIERVGSGGMGEVWLAHQTVPIRRRVAVKLIKAGMDTRQVVARFEAERQALAAMDHPNIAKAYDGGATHDGRPFFVMEYVQGLPLTEFCDRRRLDTRARLEVFLGVCSAVHHAHQKGVIHRDLKPSNLLVAEIDDRPLVKVIDFGIAKAMGGGSLGGTVHTELGQVIGTMEYVSPEQADPAGIDVDTRSDVYSLGVVLYELLVGAHPYSFGSTLAALAGALIRDVEVPRPSRRFTGLDTAEDIAARRGTSPTRLLRDLRGDLEWILLKALEKDRTRRYGSVAELSADLSRFLADDTVSARPPTVGYRARKFVRRHKVGVGLAALVFLLIAGLALSMTVQAARVARERDIAAAEAAKAAAVRDFMTRVLAAPDPSNALGPEATVLEAVDAAAKEALAGFSPEPEVDAAIRNEIGRVYLRLGRYRDAEPLLQEAFHARVRLLGPSHPDIGESLVALGDLADALSLPDSAVSLYTRGIDVLGRAGDGRDLGARVRRADLWTRQGRYAEAETELVAALEASRARDSGGLAIAEVRSRLVRLHLTTGDLSRAEEHAREALTIRSGRLPEGHPLVGESLANLAAVVDDLGRKEEAADLYRRALRILEATFGTESDQVSATLSNLALVHADLGDGSEAERLFRRALAIDHGLFGEDHVAVAFDRVNLGRHLCETGKAGEGIELVLDGRRVVDALFESTQPEAAASRSSYGACLMALGRHPEAERELLGALAAIEGRTAPDHVLARRVRDRLGDLYEAWGRPDRAGAYRRDGGA